ncbi:MAG: tetratricopeptide repeat protein [Methanomicrobiales archaeon]|jgi:tetratricopeptide (TPR) repeat protein
MRGAFPDGGILVLLLVPFIVTGGFAAPVAGKDASPNPMGGPLGTDNRSLPFLPNVSFAEPTLAAQDWYEQGFALTNEERYGEAILAYEKALSQNRSLLNAWYYTGDALFRLGRYNEALLAFSNATAVDPDFVDAYFYESLVYEKLGRSQDQKDALRRGLEAADRKEAAERAGAPSPAGSPGPQPEPVSPAVSLLGAILATGLWAFMRRRRPMGSGHRDRSS